MAQIHPTQNQAVEKNSHMIAQMQIMLSTKSKGISVLPQHRKRSRHIFSTSPKQRNRTSFGTLIVPFFSQGNQGKQTTSYWKDGALIKDKTERANIFNSYFIHIADAAAEINEEDSGTDRSTHPSIPQSILTNILQT